LNGKKNAANGLDVIWDHEEIYGRLGNRYQYASRRVAHILTECGPEILLTNLRPKMQQARKRRIRLQFICEISKANRKWVKELFPFGEVRRHPVGFGFSVYIVDEAEATIRYLNPDSPAFNTTLDMGVHIRYKHVARHLSKTFDHMWKESPPAEKVRQLARNGHG